MAMALRSSKDIQLLDFDLDLKQNIDAIFFCDFFFFYESKKYLSCTIGTRV